MCIGAKVPSYLCDYDILRCLKCCGPEMTFVLQEHMGFYTTFPPSINNKIKMKSNNKDFYFFLS